MEEITLAIDIILEAIIRPTPGIVDRLIERARKGEARLIILRFALYCALHSVQEEDKVNAKRLAELLKYAEIQPDTLELLEPQDRESWTPSQEEINNWRKCAIRDD